MTTPPPPHTHTHTPESARSIKQKSVYKYKSTLFNTESKHMYTCIYIVSSLLLFTLAGDEEVGQLLLRLGPGHAVLLSDSKVRSETNG